MDRLAESLRASRDPRIKYLIWDGRMFSAYPTSHYPAFAWRPYGGPNPHSTHLHLSVVGVPALYDSQRRWAIEEVSLPLPPESEPYVRNLVDRGLVGLGGTPEDTVRYWMGARPTDQLLHLLAAACSSLADRVTAAEESAEIARLAEAVEAVRVGADQLDLDALRRTMDRLYAPRSHPHRGSIDIPPAA